MYSKLNYPTITLSNGKTMPQFGLGTWLSEPGQVKQAVEHAIDIGYRHIDCAYCYQNQNEVGEAIKNKIEQGVVKREDLFITTKLWNTYHRKENVKEGLDVNFNELGLEFIDLILIHWPTAFNLNEDKEIMPFKDMHDNADEAHYLICWNELINLVGENGEFKDKIGALGVSNFTIDQLEDLKKNSSMMPVMNQVEGHPYLVQTELSEYCKNNNIRITNYSPLGNPGIGDWDFNKGKKRLLDNALVQELSKQYNKTPANILVRFALQRGHVVIPKSVTLSRIESNSEVFDFELSEDDMGRLLKEDGNIRYCHPDWTANRWCPF